MKMETMELITAVSVTVTIMVTIYGARRSKKDNKLDDTLSQFWKKLKDIEVKLAGAVLSRDEIKSIAKDCVENAICKHELTCQHKDGKQ